MLFSHCVKLLQYGGVLLYLRLQRFLIVHSSSSLVSLYFHRPPDDTFDRLQHDNLQRLQIRLISCFQSSRPQYQELVLNIDNHYWLSFYIIFPMFLSLCRIF